MGFDLFSPVVASYAPRAFPVNRFQPGGEGASITIRVRANNDPRVQKIAALAGRYVQWRVYLNWKHTARDAPSGQHSVTSVANGLLPRVLSPARDMTTWR